MRKTILLLFLIFTFRSQAQEIYSYNNSLSSTEQGKILNSPFTGGINSAQIQTMDVVGDQAQEWVTWDINSRQLLVFKKQDETFTHIPELTYLFPADISGFLVLIDFDGDGKKDLFTSTALGIKAYKNTSTEKGLTWQLAQNFLKIDGSANIQANNLDTPLIQDVDGDGDLDLIIFNFASGDYLEFYENTSVDRKGSLDIDGFAFPVTHWGNFEFCGCGDISFGKSCSGIDLRILKEESNRIQHAGGHSILYRDFDGDGISDLLLGRDECSVLYFLSNTGSENKPRFDTFSNKLPNYGTLPEFPIFHTAQLIENELIVSLNTSETSANFGIDFSNSIVKIDRNGQPNYSFVQDQMIDLGENTRPFYSGNKESGSIFITSNQFENGKVSSKQTLFELNNNILTRIDVINSALDKLELIDSQNLLYTTSQDKHYNIISGISTLNGIPTQKLFELIDSNYQPLVFLGYEPQRGDYLQFFAKEKLDYLLVAAQNGSLDLYELNFAASSATLLMPNFLGFSDNPANRNLTVAVHQKSTPDLYAIDQNGSLIKISNFMNSPSRKEIQISAFGQKLPTRLGRNTWIAVVKSVVEENPDLILGTRAGGLIYLKAEIIDRPNEGEFRISVYPNPSEGLIKLLSNKKMTGSLYNSLGQELLSGIQIPVNVETEIQASFLAPGLYILRLESDDKTRESRKIWIR